MKYKIPERNINVLEARLLKLRKRALKLGQALDYSRIGEEFEEVAVQHEVLGPQKVLRRYILIEVTGQQPKINGWEFLATIEHDEQAGNILRRVPGSNEFPIPDTYRTSSRICDHCKLDRNRKDTYIVRHDDGSTKQVGRQCLRDFLGHSDPHAVAEFAELLINLGDLCSDAESYDEGMYGPGSERCWEPLDILAMTSAAIDACGWLGRGRAREQGGYATADLVIDCLMPAGQRKRSESEVATLHEAGINKNVHSEQAAKAAEWAASLDDQANDYEWNLRVCAHKVAITSRDLGLACSMIFAYRKHLELEIKRAAERERSGKSEFFGTVGKREVFELELEGTRYFDGQFGTTIIHIMRQVGTSNRAVWFSTSQDLSKKIGETLRLKATIKKHEDDQRFGKQTILSRAVEVQK